MESIRSSRPRLALLPVLEETSPDIESVPVLFGSSIFAGMSWIESGEQLKRLLTVGLHGKRQRLGFGATRYRLEIPVTYLGEEVLMPLDSVAEVSAVMRHLAHLPISMRLRHASRQRAGELIGQYWFEGV